MFLFNFIYLFLIKRSQKNAFFGALSTLKKSIFCSFIFTLFFANMAFSQNINKKEDTFSGNNISNNNSYRLTSRKNRFSFFKDSSSSLLMQARYLDFQETIEQQQIVQLRLRPEAELKVNSWFNISAKATINLNSARIQTRFADNSAGSLVLDRLEANLNAYGPLSIKLGALDQSFIKNELLIEEQAFPGVAIVLEQKSKDGKLGLIAQKSLPTSVSLESDRNEDEGKASFTTAGIIGDWTFFDKLKLTASSHYFSFDGLASVTANNSRRWGNEVYGSGAADSFFKYEFRGWTQSYRLDYQANIWWTPFAELQMVVNSEAPDHSNRAQQISLGSKFTMSNIVLTPKISHFYLEANSSPASYNSSLLGHNNREGIFYQLRTDFIKQGFYVEAGYANAELIDPHAEQKDLDSFSILAGVVYELF